MLRPRSAQWPYLGGGRGILLAAILATHPMLPAAASGSELAAGAGRSGGRDRGPPGPRSRCELVPGDFCARRARSAADVYLLMSVIHDRDGVRAAAILA